MRKVINGLEHMEGTSEGSLYPICLWHDSGIVMGLRVILQKTPNPNLLAYALYARAQQFDDNGNDQKLDVDAVAKVLGPTSLKLKSGKHMSGTIIAQALNISGIKGGPVEVAEALATTHCEVVKSISKALKMTKLKDQYLSPFVHEAYYELVGYDPNAVAADPELDIPDVEDQLDGSFDFTKLLGKPST